MLVGEMSLQRHLLWNPGSSCDVQLSLLHLMLPWAWPAHELSCAS